MSPPSSATKTAGFLHAPPTYISSVAFKRRHFRPTCSSFHYRHHNLPDQENTPVPAGALPSTEDDSLRTHNAKSTALLLRHLSPQDHQNPHPPPSQRQEHHMSFSKEDEEKLLELSLLNKRSPQFPGSIFVSNSSQLVKSVFEAENTRLDDAAGDVDDEMLMKALEIRRKVTVEVFKEAMKKGKFEITYSENLISKLAYFLDCVMIKAASMKQLPELSGCLYNNRAKEFINESGVVPLIRLIDSYDLFS